MERAKRRRRTRRCLDELRRRARGGAGEAGEGARRVTRGRLTLRLGMFAKGVRSETVTRPQLRVSEEFRARRDEDLHKIIDLANGEPAAPSPPSPSAASSPCRTALAPRTTVGSDERILCIESSSPRSNVSSIDDDLFRMFKESMREIPSNIGRRLPVLVKDDTFNRTKDYLQKLYAESCHRESEANIMGCIKSSASRSKSNQKSILQETMERSILLNPIEYIKQGYYEQHAKAGTSKAQDQPSASRKRELSQNSFNQRMNVTKYSCYSPNLTRSATDESLAQFSSDSCDVRKIAVSQSSESNDSSPRISVENNCIVSLIEDSPEYTFYPRKIN